MEGEVRREEELGETIEWKLQSGCKNKKINKQQKEVPVHIYKQKTINQYSK